MEPLLGKKTTDFINALQSPPEVSVRLNPRKRMATPLFSGKSVKWTDTGYYLPERPLFTLIPQMHGGAFYVQDASSMIYKHIATYLRDVYHFGRRHTAVLDMCAAPGGKTTAIIDALSDDTLVVANEFVAKRAPVLAENLAKWGHPHCIVTNSDTSVFADAPRFDIVAVDAPCSGEGMMRKEEEAVAQWSPALVEDCARLQRKILDDACAALRPGGFLIYSTCTFNTRENEDNAAWLRDRYGLEPVEIPIHPSWRIIGALSGKIPCMRFMPHYTRGEGLFAVVFRKPDEGCRPASALKHRPSGRFSAAKNITAAKEWLEPTADWRVFERKGELFAFSCSVERMEASLGKGVRILSAGVPVATVKGKDIVPSPELALSLALREGAFPDAALDRDQALTYLRREAVTLPDGYGKGYVTVSHDGIKLGFVKNIGSRANNLYPQQWRIRMQAR